MTEKYRPSNGEEGHIFMAQWCFDGCIKHSEENPCEIMGRALGCLSGDCEEWTYSDEGEPICTAFSTEEEAYRCEDTGDLFG